MALIKCPECGKQISDKATVCIGCGYPINKKNKNKISTKSDTKYDKKLQKEAMDYAFRKIIDKGGEIAMKEYGWVPYLW